MPTTPIILIHSKDPETGLTRCGNEWAGDTYRGYQHTPRLQCPGCLMALEQELFPPKPAPCSCAKTPRYCR